MESEFIALDKAGEEAEWLRNFLEDIPNWSRLCQLYVYTVIVNQQLEEHRVICITVSHAIYDEDIIPLDNCSQMNYLN
jgi:hypothetical protein